MLLTPWVMAMRTLGGDLDRSYWAQWSADFAATIGDYRLFAAALVVGFLVAAGAFPLVVEKAGRHGPRPLTDGTRWSYAYQYPFLQNKGREENTEDYAAYLISEYYRYVEIAVFLPVGLLWGLPGWFAHALSYSLRAAVERAPQGFTASHGAMAVWAAVALFVWLRGWEKWWKPRVIDRLLDVYLEAENLMIAGVHDLKAKGYGAVSFDSKLQEDARR